LEKEKSSTPVSAHVIQNAPGPSSQSRRRHSTTATPSSATAAGIPSSGPFAPTNSRAGPALPTPKCAATRA
jgi:hypothetical protein